MFKTRVTCPFNDFIRVHNMFLYKLYEWVTYKYILPST